MRTVLGALSVPHKRSLLNLQKRVIRSEIFRHAYHDKFAGEIVSRLNRNDLLNMLNFKCLNIWQIPDVEKGEVLIDSRGKGSLQQKNTT